MKKIRNVTDQILWINHLDPNMKKYISFNSDIPLNNKKPELKYEEISANETPLFIVKILNYQFYNYNLKAVYCGEDGSYKVALDRFDQDCVLYFNNGGKLLKRKISLLRRKWHQWNKINLNFSNSIITQNWTADYI